MRNIATSHRSNWPFSESDRSGNSSDSLRHYAGRYFIPVDCRSDNRNLGSRAKGEIDRQRAVLAKLVAEVAPDRADAISTTLLHAFGSLGRTLSQTLQAQQRVLGDEPHVISLLQSTSCAIEEGLRSDLAATYVTPNDPALGRYLIASIGNLAEETLRVMFMDCACRLLGESDIARGTVDKLTIYPRVILRRALEFGASAILLAHNHPGGSTNPSKGDIDVTRELVKLANAIDIEIEDHLIVTAVGVTSMRRLGLL